MSKKKRRSRRPSEQSESNPGDAVTVAWMLSTATTLLCAGVAAVVWIFVRNRADNDTAMLLARYLHFSAVVTAVVSLALLGAVLKIRRVAPPPVIIVAAVIIAALPILAVFF